MDDLTRFANKLENHHRDIEKDWRAEWAPELADEMSRRAPRDTGRLAASMKVTDEGVIADTPYAVYVARGTARMAPQPFDIQAILAVIDNAAEGAGEILIQELTR